MCTADRDVDDRPSADVLFERELGPRRRRQRQPAEVLSPDIDVPAPSAALLPVGIAARSAPSAEEEVLNRFSESEVRAALAELPVGFRAAIYLVDGEGYSYRDAAEMIGVPIGTVMSRLHRARKRVREQLWSGAQASPSN
jgi:RNA polymerase sigma-70 factor, ECF subfamily